MSKTLKLKVTGVCMIIMDGKRYHHGDEIEIESDRINDSAIEYLIARGDVEVKDNSEINEQIKEKAEKKRKKDPTEGKSRKELEDGGEY
ncbi:hypothetical protein tunzivis_54 [Escherichia phage tunzivis]|nr:hypothetical protein tunzivis_54 [Escherichia phage tunzivis]